MSECEFHCRYCGRDVHLAANEPSPETDLISLREALAKAEGERNASRAAHEETSEKLNGYIYGLSDEMDRSRAAEARAAALEALLGESQHHLKEIIPCVRDPWTNEPFQKGDGIPVLDEAIDFLAKLKQRSGRVEESNHD